MHYFPLLFIIVLSFAIEKLPKRAELVLHDLVKCYQLLILTDNTARTTCKEVFLTVKKIDIDRMN